MNCYGKEGGERKVTVDDSYNEVRLTAVIADDRVLKYDWLHG